MDNERTEANLLICELQRARTLLMEGPEEKESPWTVRHRVAEMKAKFHEIRRDMVRYERQFLQ